MINTEKEKIINELKKLESYVNDLNQKYDFEMEDLIEKIKTAISNLEKSKFIVAVFGAFSDGKSTILSAITKDFNIKISPEPTTDKIVEYPYGEFIFVDTPGIFSDNLMHDEKTKKFISEANVIIFVCDAVNPIKQSHIPVLKWLFNELGKLDVTLFVLNKMDLVVSLEDDSEFKKMSEIKKNTLLESLKDIVNISSKIPIICISANPYDLGFDNWMNKWGDYEKLSRIGALIAEIKHTYDLYKEQLIIKAGISVIREILLTYLKNLKIANEITYERFKINENLANELEHKMKVLKNNIRDSFDQYKQELINLRQDVLLKLKFTKDFDDLRKIVEIELGKDGEVLKSNIEKCINRALSPLDEASVSINKELDFAIANSIKLDQELVNTISTGIVKISDKILSFKTSSLMQELFKIRKDYGLDKIIKFQGKGTHMKWASKWANRLQKFARIGKVLGPILTGIFILKDIHDTYKFNKNKNDIKDEIHNVFLELLNINYDEYIETFIPYVIQFENKFSTYKQEIEHDRKIIDSIAKDILNIEDMLNKFKYLPK